MNRLSSNLYRLYAGCAQIYPGDVEKLFSDPDRDLASIESFREMLLELGGTECEVADFDLLTDTQRCLVTENAIRIESYGLLDGRINDKWFKGDAPSPGVGVAWDYPLPEGAFAKSLLSRHLVEPSVAKSHSRTVDAKLTSTIRTRTSNPNEPPKAGDVVGRCRLEREIGRGAFSVVYQAQHLKLRIPVAVKVLLPESKQTSNELNPILSEARLLAQISHPNVVRVYEVEDEDVHPHLVMERVEGESLATRIERGVLSPAEAIQIGIQTAEGLAATLRHGMIHRDIKPANILLTTDGQVKVVDFGLGVSVQDPSAAGSDDREMVGTASYMSPEAAKSAAKVDHRADIYSLGITLYQALTGTVPFTGSSLASVLMKHVMAEPPPIEGRRQDVPPRLKLVIMRMLAKNPADRYQTYDVLIADLQRCAQGTASGPEAIDEQAASKRSGLWNWFGRSSAKARG